MVRVKHCICIAKSISYHLIRQFGPQKVTLPFPILYTTHSTINDSMHRRILADVNLVYVIMKIHVDDQTAKF